MIANIDTLFILCVYLEKDGISDNNIACDSIYSSFPKMSCCPCLLCSILHSSIPQVLKICSASRTSIVEQTGRLPVEPLAKPDFLFYTIPEVNYSAVLIQWLPCKEDQNCSTRSTGSNFYVKYR